MNDARLEADYGRLKRLVDLSPNAITIERATGRPPREYLLTLRCKGLEATGPQTPKFRMSHAVEILLGPDYPFAEPSVRMTTPIVHPHIWTSNRVCLGKWVSTEYLDALVKRLFRIIQFDPDFLDGTSIANQDAQRWAQANRSLLPLGTFAPGDEPPPPARPKFIFRPT